MTTPVLSKPVRERKMVEMIEKLRQKTLSTRWECPKCSEPGMGGGYCAFDRRKLICIETWFEEEDQRKYNQALNDVLLIIKDSNP